MQIKKCIILICQTLISLYVDVYDVDGNKVDVKIDKMTVYQNMLLWFGYR